MNDSLVLTDVEEIDKCWVYADPRPGIRAYLRELLATQGNEAVVAELEKATSTIQVRAPDTSAAGLLQDLLAWIHRSVRVIGWSDLPSRAW